MMKSKKQKELTRAKGIQKSLGIRVAAGYMRKRGWSLNAALWHLLNATERHHQSSWYSYGD